METGYPVQALGRRLLAFSHYLGDLTLFTLRSFRLTTSRPFFLVPLIEQIQAIGIRSLPLVSVAALAIGLVMAMQTSGILMRFGSASYMSTIVGLSMVRELGPMITALMVAGRCGSGISAELGSMKVTRQIDAMQVSAINPIRFLVVPRILACIISMPLLTIWANVVGITGGLIIGVTQLGIGPAAFLQGTIRFLDLQDLGAGLSKTLFFGLIVGGVGCFQGFRTTKGTAGVGRSTTMAVVTSSLLIVVADIFLTRLTL